MVNCTKKRRRNHCGDTGNHSLSKYVSDFHQKGGGNLMNNSDDFRSSYFIVFLDLLGTREIGLEKSGEFKSAMTVFARKVCEQFASVIDIYKKTPKNEISLYFFSDCLYMQSKNLYLLLIYLRDLRFTLLKDKIFFKASVVKGQLSANSKIENIRYETEGWTDEQKDMMGEISKNFNFILFTSQDICKAFEFQNKLKGAGIYIDEDIKLKYKNNNTDKKLFSKSVFYNPIEASYNKYYDLSFDLRDFKEKEESAIFDAIWDGFIDGYKKNKKYGHNYMSLLSTFLSSIDTSSYAKHEDYSDLPEYIKKFILLKGNYHLRESIAPWYNYLVLLFLDTLCNNLSKKEKLLNSIIKNVVKENKRLKQICSKNFELIPKTIIAEKNRRIITQEILSPTDIETGIEDDE
jgi:hypothetical protein